MVQDIKTLVEQYSTWLKEKTYLSEIEDCVEVTTPYLDRRNDYLQIYVRRLGDDYLLTDNGYILDDLEVSGCNIDSIKRKNFFNMTLNGFGVEANGNALEVKTASETFSLRKHNLVQAMLAINDLFYLASPTESSSFLEEVTNWLDHSEIRYTPSIKFTGKSGYDHRFDFVIPKSKTQPERVLRTINRPSRDSAQSMVFSWIDIKEVRLSDARAYAFLNDSESNIQTDVLDAMRNYEVHPISWSTRNEALCDLAA